MRSKQLTSFLLATTVGMLIAGAASAQVTVFEGARVIVGDGRVLDNTTIVVSGSKITQVGGAAPADATRVNLSGKTVMPLIIDTHTHLSTTRDALVRDLRQRAYFGVGAALSLGTDNYERENTLRLLANEGQLLGEITAALERLDKGTFGRCEECGGPIQPRERLRELPYTRYCVECARKVEQSA